MSSVCAALRSVALLTMLVPTVALSQAAVNCSPPAGDAKIADESGLQAWMVAYCQLTIYALGDDGRVWKHDRRAAADGGSLQGVFPDELRWKRGWYADDAFGTNVASAPSIARDKSDAVTLVDGTIRVGSQNLGGSARHVETQGNASRIFYARPFILNWWPNHDPKLLSTDAEPTHTAVFLWWADGYVYYRTRSNTNKTAWSKWIRLPQTRVYSDPAVVARLRQPYLDVFAQGENNTLVHWTWNGDKWLFETVPIAKIASAPVVLIENEGKNWGINTAATSAGKYSCSGKYGSLAFHDAFATGLCWSCPQDFKRTVWQPIGHYRNGKWTGISNGCEKGGLAGIGASFRAATHHGPMGCTGLSFRNGLTDDCYSCPGRGQRTIVPGNDLTKMSGACRQTVWGTFNVFYRGISGKIEEMMWDLSGERSGLVQAGGMQNGWFATKGYEGRLPKELATISSAPVIAAMQGLWLFARDASGEFHAFFAGGAVQSHVRVGAPRKPAPGNPAIVDVAVFVERWR